jgi:hypothetical protein
LKNLEESQQEMRERQNRNTEPKPRPVRKATPPVEQIAEANVGNDVNKLKQRITALENENQRLRTEIQQLRRQKTGYVEVERQKSADEQRREQVHNYFKYSNARRW